MPYPGWTLYSTSKSALIGLTKGLARDLGPRGITANLVHPGSTNTEMNPAVGPEADEERRYTALNRYCDPDDIAATVVHLAGEGGCNITRASIAVDAGATAQPPGRSSACAGARRAPPTARCYQRRSTPTQKAPGRDPSAACLDRLCHERRPDCRLDRT